ncbi:hypothetical protein IFO70_32485 [Phormidium tenue FACHB-886]|nr:hypothetical protein [Phormidium tenue FACHB-886]
MITSPSHQPALQRFEFVREWDDKFLALFPHRGDYLWAEHPEPGKRPQWHTESKHLLSDRLLRQGSYLYGVRFGSTTQYLMLDVDARSAYHPCRDPFAINRMLEALEEIGLVSCVAISSSYSNGIHLYFPFEEALPCWLIALAAKTLLENKGFKLRGGQLELFPNPKPYSELPQSYNGHRLPLQLGSYLLNEDWQPVFTSQIDFVRQWQLNQKRNAVSLSQLKRLAQSAQRKTYKKIKADGQKYLNDLNQDIEAGWTGSGQTQFIVGKIANRERVFYHALHGGEPLEGKALAKRIVEVARSLPGYEEYCGHKQEIDQLAECWARAAERRYYPYAFDKPLSQDTAVPPTKTEPTWNERQAQEAKERIRAAIADLLEKGTLPAQATARRLLLKTYGIANTTLDKNCNLWHPAHLKPLQEEQYHPIESNLENLEQVKPTPDMEYHPVDPNKLSSDPVVAPPAQETGETQNWAVGGSGGDSTRELTKQNSVNSGPRLIREILDRLEKSKLTRQAESQQAAPPPDEHYFQVGKNGQIELFRHRLELPTPPSLPPVTKSFATKQDAPKHQLAPEQELQELLTPQISLDICELIAAIQVEFARLGWSLTQAKGWIAEHFEGKSRWQLTDAELIQLLRKLQQSPP